MAAAAAASSVARAPSIRRLTAQKAAVRAYSLTLTFRKTDPDTETLLYAFTIHLLLLGVWLEGGN